MVSAVDRLLNGDVNNFNVIEGVPGSGKTLSIELAIENLIQSGVPDGDIIVYVSPD